MAFKKKLYRLSPDKIEEQFTYKIQQTKRKQFPVKVTAGSNERNVREQLAHKLSGSHMGLWLLIPEYLRLGSWDLLTGIFGSSPDPLSPQLALQMVNESALCVNGIRARGSLCNQGFSLANGLSFLASDESIHQILDSRDMQDYERMQETLLQLRKLNGHYQDRKIVLAHRPAQDTFCYQKGNAQKEEKARRALQKNVADIFL